MAKRDILFLQTRREVFHRLTTLAKNDSRILPLAFQVLQDLTKWLLFGFYPVIQILPVKACSENLTPGQFQLSDNIILNHLRGGGS